MSDGSFVIALMGMVMAAPAWAFCFIGSKSAKNQIAELRDRIEQLEVAVGKNNPGSES